MLFTNFVYTNRMKKDIKKHISRIVIVFAVYNIYYMLVHRTFNSDSIVFCIITVSVYLFLSADL